MTSLALIPITRVRAKSGYIYLAKVNKKTENTEGCYKLGSTENIDARMKALRCQYKGDITLVAYGFTNARLKAERFLHSLFVSCAWTGVNKVHVFWWDKELYGFDRNGLETFLKILGCISSFNDATPNPGELAKLMKEK